ncbi:class I SAM-dependent methyltransferase [Cryptosporangium aurantiacum]|uniref:Methyltransferase domain-containing protein n=1 Tax=Cryptosporangium aurantiacum TaxID=134849 RepID=A0A1M7RKV9_9ACTN|nr:class I SAM-dependent methyltransferase [Cryptosporangium aurantiacum]SHN46708.1 Methyltransferase domain-containing protein [Cryptosporangium aurantiacum]
MFDDSESISDADLVREQYSDHRRLAARQALWRLEPGPPLVDTVLRTAAVQDTETILDIGCGNGALLAALRARGHAGTLIGVDLSAGMARTAATHAPVAIADVQALPVRSASVDVAMSLHVLYHVPDLDRAAAELRRVVKPGGRAMIATNGAGHTSELKQVLATAADRVAGVRRDPDREVRRFDTLRARDLFGTVFDAVAVIDAGRSFAVHDPDVVGDYLASWSPRSVGMRAGPAWDAVVAEARALIRTQVSDHGAFMVTSRAAILRCT